MLECVGDQVGEFEYLVGVEPWIATGQVARRQVGIRYFIGAAGAFGYVLAGHLQMDPTGVAALRLVHREKLLQLAQNSVELPGFEAGTRFDRVAVHRIARPDHLESLPLHRANQLRQRLRQHIGTHARNQRESSGLVIGIERFDQFQQFVGFNRRPDFDADRVLDVLEELDMRVILLARAFADPDEMRRTVVALTGKRIDPRQVLLVIQ